MPLNHTKYLKSLLGQTPILLFGLTVSLLLVTAWQSKQGSSTHALDSNELTALLSQADYYALNEEDSLRNPRRGMELYKKALQPLRQHTDSLAKWLEVNRRIATIFDLDFKKRDSAQAHVKSTLAELAQWRKTATDEEHNALVLLYLRQISIAKKDADLATLKLALEQTEQFLKANLWGKEHKIIAYFFQQMPNLHVRLAGYETAVNYFKEALKYEQDFNKVGEIVNYNDYGNIYQTLEDYDTALALFEKGLSQKTQSYYISTFLYLNKADALINLNRIEEAKVANQTAWRRMLNRDSFSEESYGKCHVGYWENVAMLHQKAGRLADTRQFYERIMSDSLTLDYIGRRELASYYALIANTYLQENNPTTALSYYHKAYLKYYPNAGDDPKVLPNAGELPGDKVLIHILEGKAQSWAMLQQYADALKAYERIPEIEAQLRATHSFEKSTLLALEQSRQRFDRVVGLAWEAWEKTKDPTFAATAFHFTEQARGVLQTKGLHANEASALLEADQQQADKALANEIAIVQNQLDNADEAALDTLMVNMRALKQQQQKMRGEWAKSNPAYAAAIGENKVLAATAVGKLLRKGQTLLDYYFGQDQQLYLFAFDADGNAAWARRAWAQDAQVATDTLLQLISRNPAEGDAALFAKHALVLGQHLLAAPDAVFLGQKSPVLDTCLLVIPDLELAALPFDLLLTQPATGNDWSAMPYALRQYRIGYGYSVSLLGMQQAITQKRSGKARVPFVGFAPDYHDGTPPLEKADDDVRFGAQLFNGQPLVGPEATEAQYRELAEQAQILLLSMHGISNHERPGLSCLRMGDTIKTGPYDNVLHANELQAIPCRADLAVMSACFTGDGPVKVGEGVYSMARSFAIAGVPATTMSLWKFPVKSSSALVCDFLTGIHQKMSKEVALHRAKVNWLAQNQGSKFAHPYFWAGMVAAGDMSPLQTNSNRWWYLAAALGALLLAGAWWLMRR